MPFSLLRPPIMRPDVVLLDDSLSAVYTINEQHILTNFNEARQGTPSSSPTASTAT